MSEMSTAITEATEASRLHVMSTVESRSDYILSEIQNLVHNQRENTSQICAKFQDMKGYYKGQVSPGGILHALQLHIVRSGNYFRGTST